MSRSMRVLNLRLTENQDRYRQEEASLFLHDERHRPVHIFFLRRHAETYNPKSINMYDGTIDLTAAMWNDLSLWSTTISFRTLYDYSY